MEEPRRRLSGEWPPTLERHRPEVLDWRLNRVEAEIDHLHDKIHASSWWSAASALPWGQIVGLILLCGLGLLGRVSPELGAAMAKLLTGVK